MAFERWQDHTAEEKQMKSKALKVVQRLMNGALVSSFERWRDHVIEEKQMESKAQRLISGALVKVFGRWRNNVIGALRERMAFMQEHSKEMKGLVLRKMLVAARLRRQQQHFCGWVRAAGTHAQVKALLRLY